MHSPASNTLLALNGQRRALAISLLCLFAFLVIVWFGTPYLAKIYINESLRNLPEYEGKVDWVRIHPLTASVDIYNFHMDKKTGKVPVPFVFTPHILATLQWSEILHGKARSSISIWNPEINLVSGPDSSQSQTSISMVWIDAIKKLIPWQINELRVYGGNLHFRDFHSDPQIDLPVNHIEVRAENMSNSEGLKTPLPTKVTVSANPLVKGIFKMDLSVNLDEKYATFMQRIKVEKVPAQAANSALKKYLKVMMKSGDLEFYSELSGDKGIYHGYVKAFFIKFEFEPKPSDKDSIGEVWSGILNGFKGLIQNNKKVIATESKITGRVDKPSIDTVGTLIGVLWNAYIQSLTPGFDPLHTPPKPGTTTVVTEDDNSQSDTKSEGVEK